MLSLLLLPLDLALGIIDLIRSAAESTDLFGDMRKHVKQAFNNYLHMLSEAAQKDEFTQGVVAGRTLVNVVLLAIGGYGLFKAGTKLFGALRRSAQLARATKNAEQALAAANVSEEAINASIRDQIEQDLAPTDDVPPTVESKDVRKKLNEEIGQEQRDLLKEFFGQGIQNALLKEEHFQVPEGLSDDTLQIARQIAENAVNAGKDSTGVQAARIRLIDRALSERK